MLVIRAAQMKAFAAALRSSFLLRLAGHLHQRLGGRSLEDFQQLASASVAEARDLGFSTESDLTRFAEYAALYGQPLAAVTDPLWIGLTIRRSDLSPAEKLDVLDSHYTFGRSM